MTYMYWWRVNAAYPMLLPVMGRIPGLLEPAP